MALVANIKGPQGPQGPQGEPASSTISKMAEEEIIVGDLVAIGSTAAKVIIADNSAGIDHALVYGIAKTAASAGSAVTVFLGGELTDSGFSIFPRNKLLFLDALGGITDTRPTSGYMTIIGKSLGGGTIWFQPQIPTVLG